MPLTPTKVSSWKVYRVDCELTWSFVRAAGCYFRVYGKGPRDFTEDSLAVQQYLKFETSTKAFKQLHVKAISNNVDGVVIEVTGPSKLRT